MRLDQRPYIKIFLSKVFGLDGSTDYIRSTHVIIVADDPGRFTSAHRRGGGGWVRTFHHTDRAGSRALNPHQHRPRELVGV